VRCAIYTRKSSEEGLEQEFNSLQAQREACEAFINSQVHEGWRIASPEMLPEAEILPHLICSRPIFIGGANDEADQHGGA
jgi:hypothetical protein